MESPDTNALKKWCKDEESFKKVKSLVENIVEEGNELEKRLGLLESAIRSDYDSILITELTLEKPGPRIVYVNDGFCEMTGYSKEEVIGKTPRILQGPKTDRDVLDKLKRRLKEGKSFFGQAINYRKDGSEFVNQWDIHPLTDKEGNITHWVSYQHDITKRKRAEEQLVDQKVEFDKLREESKRTVVDIDVQGNIVMANKAFRELVGYGKNELKQIKIWDLLPDKYMSSIKGRFDKEDEDAYFNDQEFKGIINHKNGFPIQVKGTTSILDLKDQKLIRAEIENISLKKRIMDTLKKRNKYFGRVVRQASEFSYKVGLKDEKPVFKTVSEEFPEVTGLSADAVIGKTDAGNFIHQDDLEKFNSHLQKVFKGKESTCEYRLKNNKGEFVKVLDYGKPEWDQENKNVVTVCCAVSVDPAYEKSKV
ncbi:PAS domain S-box protein [Aliifodinibius salipaludis]|uniref:histidine kinase n=1 Tax=Fodinibius salipaludis TaxID=2032627 RepID=A0A2A2GED5_9BACT|nr:PAS domain S-box protein [Aliifodinibius salipaludis]PAU95122.1 PAS domain S-box protein [Aliifodinibius salipaludis]